MDPDGLKKADGMDQNVIQARKINVLGLEKGFSFRDTASIKSTFEELSGCRNNVDKTGLSGKFKV